MIPASVLDRISLSLDCNGSVHFITSLGMSGVFHSQSETLGDTKFSNF